MSNSVSQSAAWLTTILDHSMSENTTQKKIIQIFESKSEPRKFKKFTSAKTGSIVPNVLRIGRVRLFEERQLGKSTKL